MASDAARDTVNALIALDAESLAQQAAQHVATACHYTGAVVLAIAVRSKGLWTDRVATEVDERVSAKQRVPHEGLAYALAQPLGGLGPFAAPTTPEETVAVIEASEVLGDTRQAGEIAGVLYGDDAAKEMGCTPLGIPQYAGYRWAIQRAAAHLRAHGAPAALADGLLRA